MSKLGVEISIILATSVEEPTETLGSTDDSVLLLTRTSNTFVMNVGKDLDDSGPLKNTSNCRKLLKRGRKSPSLQAISKSN